MSYSPSTLLNDSSLSLLILAVGGGYALTMQDSINVSPGKRTSITWAVQFQNNRYVFQNTNISGNVVYLKIEFYLKYTDL